MAAFATLESGSFFRNGLSARRGEVARSGSVGLVVAVAAGAGVEFATVFLRGGDTGGALGSPVLRLSSYRILAPLQMREHGVPGAPMCRVGGQVRLKFVGERRT